MTKLSANRFFIIGIFFCLLVCAALCLGACKSQKKTPTQLVIDYYEGYESGDFNHIKNTINDSISITSGDYVSTYSPTRFYDFFRWDSVLQTNKKIKTIADTDSGVLVTISYSSERYTFLNNNHLTCNYIFNFENDKISTITELDCPNADWSTWEKQVDSLVNWTKKNHPELDGFINDLTMKGALNYVKAIELYENRTSNKEQ